uniref:Uncharacterized protein n=1 Tax=Glossina austeni TaxID=7395 RepID=A0A1A9UDD2_GLOAU
MKYGEAIVLQQHGEYTVSSQKSEYPSPNSTPSGLEAQDDFREDDPLKTEPSEKVISGNISNVFKRKNVTIDTNLNAALKNAEHHTKNQYHHHRIAPNKKLTNES